jgi:hypothetical protein
MSATVNPLGRPLPFAVLCAVVVLVAGGRTTGQDRLPTMPGYDQYQRMSKEIPGAIKSGSLSVVWKDGGAAFEYRHDGKAIHYDIATQKAVDRPTGKDAPSDGPPVGKGPGGRFPPRGKTVRREGAEFHADDRRPPRPPRMVNSRRSIATATSGCLMPRGSSRCR